MAWHVDIEPLSACVRFFEPGAVPHRDPYAAACSAVWRDRRTVELRGIVLPEGSSLYPLREEIREAFEPFGTEFIELVRIKPGRQPRRVRIPTRPRQ